MKKVKSAPQFAACMLLFLLVIEIEDKLFYKVIDSPICTVFGGTNT